MNYDRPVPGLSAALSKQPKGEERHTAPKISKAKPAAMQDLKRCKLGNAEPDDSFLAKPLPFGVEILSTSVAAEPHVAQASAPSSPADTVTSIPPGAVLIASGNSAIHDAATEDRQFHSGLIGLTAGSFVAPSRPCGVASYSYVNDDASRPLSAILHVSDDSDRKSVV